MAGPALLVRASTSARSRALARAFRVAAYGLACLAVARLLWTVDLQAVEATLGAVGPLAPLVLLPLGLQVLLEAGSWRLLLAKLGHLVPWRVSWRVNLQAEAVRMSFPGGPALAEGLRPLLFTRHSSVPLSDGASALAVRKLCHFGTHGLFLGVGAAMGTALAARWAPQLGSAGRVLPVLSYAVAAGLTVGAMLLGLMLLRGSLATRAERFLTRLTRGRLSSFLEKRRAAYAAMDGRLQVLLGCHSGALFWNVGTALGGWLLDATETLLILWLLGFRLGWGEAIAVEALVSVIRVLAFAVPGGLGIQDFSYHALLQGTVGDAASMSFILLKRGRDAFWVVTGYLLPVILDRFPAGSTDRVSAG